MWHSVPGITPRPLHGSSAEPRSPAEKSRLFSRQGRVLLARGDDGRAGQRGAGGAGQWPEL